jgi:crooked neck
LVSDGIFGWQRVALLQVWKSFEEQHGTADDIAKVEGMMPVQGKRRYVDEETGQLVEGTRLAPLP